MYDVFLSYNRQDQEAVERVAKALRERGLQVYLDRWYLVSGRPWIDELEKTLASCRSIAIFVGPSGIGRWQQREKDLALDRQAHDPDFPVIPVLLPDGDPALGFLKLNTWVDLRGGYTPEAIEILASAARGQPPGDDLKARVATALASICPYRGLLHFREEDEPFFCGRDAFTNKLVDVVAKSNLVAVVGASGSGKSSVVRAGLVPRLRRNNSQHVAHRQVWDMLTMLPRERPLYSLAECLIPLLEPDMSEVGRLSEAARLADYLSAGQVRLRAVIDRALSKQRGTDRILLVVDQWEELYTLCTNDSERQRFIDHLLDASSDKLAVTLTVRGDFYGHVLSDRRLSDRLQDGVVNIGPMTREELRSAIVDPAQQVGLRFEQGLVERILSEVGDEPGRLPLLEFLLTQLWEKREGNELLHKTYDAIGGVKRAIADRAEAAFKRLPQAEQEAAQSALLRLVTPGEGAEDGRRRAGLADLEPLARTVVAKLTAERLLVTMRDSKGREWVEVGHEALIREWQRLRQWVNDNRDALRTVRRLEEEADIWKTNGRLTEDLLQPGRRLAEADEVLKTHPKAISEDVRVYVDASLAAERDRQEAMREAERRRQEEIQRVEREKLEREKAIALERAEHQRLVAEQERAKAEAARRLVWRTRVFAIAASILVIIASVIAGVAVQRHNTAQTEAHRADEALKLALDRTKLFLTYAKNNVGNGKISMEAAQKLLEDVEPLVAGLQKLERTAGANDSIIKYQLELLWAISDVYSDMGKTKDALQRAREARAVAERRATAQPDKFESVHTFFMSAFRIGDMLSKQNDLQGAIDEYRLALANAERAAAIKPEDADAQGNRSFVLNKIGNIYQLLGDVPAALKQYHAALDIAKSAVTLVPTNIHARRQLATAHSWIGEIHRAHGDLNAAITHLEAELKIREELARDATADDPIAQSNLAASLSRVGDVQLLRADYDRAQDYYIQAYRIRKAISDKDHDNLDARSALAGSHQSLGDVLRLKGKLADAKAEYDKAMPIREALIAKDASNVSRQSNLAGGHMRIGDILAAQGDANGALERYRTAIATIEPFMTGKGADNVTLRRDLFAYQTRIADVLATRGPPGPALDAYRVALKSAELLVPRKPLMARWQPTLPYTYNKVADLLRATGDITEAVATYRRAIEIAQQLGDGFWNSAAGPKDFAESGIKLADILDGQDDNVAAENQYRATLDILKKAAEKRAGKDLSDAIAIVEAELRRHTSTASTGKP